MIIEEKAEEFKTVMRKSMDKKIIVASSAIVLLVGFMAGFLISELQPSQVKHKFRLPDGHAANFNSSTKCMTLWDANGSGMATTCLPQSLRKP